MPIPHILAGITYNQYRLISIDCSTYRSMAIVGNTNVKECSGVYQSHGGHICQDINFKAVATAYIMAKTCHTLPSSFNIFCFASLQCNLHV